MTGSPRPDSRSRERSPACSDEPRITEESFEDLEEALLRADVGIGVTTELLDGLRAKVAAKEITEPQALIDALEAEMVSRLEGCRPHACVR